MTRIRKSIALIVLAASLVFPTGVFAASSGTTEESGISGPTMTLTIVVPATATFLDASPNWAYVGNITGIQTNNPAGLTISATVTPFVGSSATVPTTARTTYMDNPTGTDAALLTKGANIPAGDWTDSNTSKVIASSTGMLLNGANIGVNHEVLKSAFTVVGSYTSSVTYTAIAN